MNKNNAHAAHQVLREDNMLGKIVARVGRLKALNDFIKQFLPTELKEHIQVANYDKGRLFIEIDNNSFGHLFHYQKQDLLQQLRYIPEFSNIISIEHRVNPALKFAPKKAKALRPPTKLSINNLQLLIELANSTEDTKLKQSILNLIEHQQAKKNQ